MIQSGVDRTDPECLRILWILVDDADPVRGQTVGLGEDLEGPPVVSNQPATGAQPQFTIPVTGFLDRPDAAGRKSIGLRIAGDLVSHDLVQPSVERADPEVALAVLVDRVNPVARQSLFGAHRGSNPVAKTHQRTHDGANPHVTLRILTEGRIWKVLERRDALCPAVTVSVQCSFADPERPGSIDHQRHDGRSTQTHRRGQILDMPSLDTVQSTTACDPDGSVRATSDCLYEVVIEPVAGRQDAERAVPDDVDTVALTGEPEGSIFLLEERAPHHHRCRDRHAFQLSW